MDYLTSDYSADFKVTRKPGRLIFAGDIGRLKIQFPDITSKYMGMPADKLIIVCETEHKQQVLLYDSNRAEDLFKGYAVASLNELLEKPIGVLVQFEHFVGVSTDESGELAPAKHCDQPLEKLVEQKPEHATVPPSKDAETPAIFSGTIEASGQASSEADAKPAPAYARKRRNPSRQYDADFSPFKKKAVKSAKSSLVSPAAVHNLGPEEEVEVNLHDLLDQELPDIGIKPHGSVPPWIVVPGLDYQGNEVVLSQTALLQYLALKGEKRWKDEYSMQIIEELKQALSGNPGKNSNDGAVYHSSTLRFNVVLGLVDRIERKC